MKNVGDIDEIIYLQFLNVFCIHCNDLIIIFVFLKKIYVVWFLNLFFATFYFCTFLKINDK